jgi:hypothetical protein
MATSLQALCTARLVDIVLEEPSTQLEALRPVLHLLPQPTREALLALLRNTQASSELFASVLPPLCESLLRVDLSGLPLPEAGCALNISSAVELNVQASSSLSSEGLQLLLSSATNLQTLRLGGCVASNAAALGVLQQLLPSFSAAEVRDDWESHPPPEPLCPRLLVLYWPELDARKAAEITARCPRLRVNSGGQRIYSPSSERAPGLDSDVTPRKGKWRDEVHLAELFRLAYVSRDLRLAPKRAKNARQNLRRAQRAADPGAEDRLSASSLALRGGVAQLLRRMDSLPVDGR